MKTYEILLPARLNPDKTAEVVYHHDEEKLTIDKGIDNIELDIKQTKQLRDYLNELILD